MTLYAKYFDDENFQMIKKTPLLIIFEKIFRQTIYILYFKKSLIRITLKILIYILSLYTQFYIQ